MFGNNNNNKRANHFLDHRFKCRYAKHSIQGTSSAYSILDSHDMNICRDRVCCMSRINVQLSLPIYRMRLSHNSFIAKSIVNWFVCLCECDMQRKHMTRLHALHVKTTSNRKAMGKKAPATPFETANSQTATTTTIVKQI